MLQTSVYTLHHTDIGVPIKNLIVSVLFQNHSPQYSSSSHPEQRFSEAVIVWMIRMLLYARLAICIESGILFAINYEHCAYWILFLR